MAEGSAEGEELPRCSTLFLMEDGSQMLFYMTPCAMKTRLRPLIHHGGGHLSSKVLPESIKLAAPGTSSNLSGYISTDYIFDSIKHNKLQDMKKYNLKSPDSSAHVTSSKSEKSKLSTVKISPRSRKRHGRHKYTHDEDLALIKFVTKHSVCCAIKGNALYKKAEQQKITGHSWQSMRDHYIKVLYKLRDNKQYKHLFSRRRSLESAGNPEGKDKADSKNKSAESKDRKVTDETSKSTDQPRMTRAQALKMKESVNSQNKRAVTEGKDESSAGTDQERITRAKSPKIKGKSDGKNKNDITDDSEEANAGTDQEMITRAKSPRVKGKSDGKNNKDITDDTEGKSDGKNNKDMTDDTEGKSDGKNNKDMTDDTEGKSDGKNNKDMTDDTEGKSDGKNNKDMTDDTEGKSDGKNINDMTDDTEEANTDDLPDAASTHNIDDETSPAEDVDYDKLFDENLLKQAYKSKKKDTSENDSDSTEDEGAAKENEVSSSQETVKKATTKSRKTPKKDQEKLSDFDGEVVFRDDLKSHSTKVHNDEEDSEDKRPLAKRNKRDSESPSDDGNSSGIGIKEQEAFMKYYQALQSNLQKLQAYLTVPQILHALLVSSGQFDDAEEYVQNGTGKEQWTSREDKILLSKNKEEISSLAKKRGIQAVVDRINFMEGIN